MTVASDSRWAIIACQCHPRWDPKVTQILEKNIFWQKLWCHIKNNFFLQKKYSVGKAQTRRREEKNVHESEDNFINIPFELAVHEE